MRPFVAAALRHPISRLGVALTTASALLFLALVAIQVVGFLQNPYAGLVVFIMVPALVLLGLVLIPIGVLAERRRGRRGQAGPVWPRLDLRDPTLRGTILALVAITLVNLLIMSMASYGAVEYMDSQSFCGQACHTPMQPEFVAHQAGPHGQVHCVACHVGPGVQGFVEAKLSGTRRLALMVTGGYRRPIPTPVHGLPSVSDSCGSCHQSDRFVGDRVKVVYEHADDASNTPTATTLRLHVGGPIGGAGTGTGIHWHMNRANDVEYVALDAQREQIPYVRVATPDGAVREYFAEGVTSADLEGKSRRRMDCLDCHSRPAHRFAASPEREVDRAIGSGQISPTIPFIRREAVRALKADYASQDLAGEAIERTIREGVRALPTNPLDDTTVNRAIAITQTIYRTNIFPSMKVGWGTYANQLGHTTSTGCFRCHDENHKTKEGVAIRQDCDMCHGIE